MGMPSLPTPIIPHPVGGRKPEEIRSIADEALAQIEQCLLTPADQLADEYRNKYPEQTKIFKAKPLFT